MRVGIEKIDCYAPRFCVDAVELAKARGRDPIVAAERLMLHTRSVTPPFEDAVTLAVNAAKRLLAPEDLAAIELLIVGTESGVDFGKPISSWVQRFCGLPASCRNFEVKHACYGTTAALKLAVSWLSSGSVNGKKALILSTDLTRPFPQDGYDFAGGGVATAMLVSAKPAVLEIDPERYGCWAEEISDTFRPTSRTEVGNNQMSLYSYLDALEGAFEEYERRVGRFDYDADYGGHIYHAPFPGMTLEAHRTLLHRSGSWTEADILDNFKRKVEPGLHFAQLLGTAYGSSNFISLIGMMHRAEKLRAGQRVSIFAYGSGCQAEFYDGSIGPGAELRSDFTQHLASRRTLSLEQYEAVERERWDAIDQEHCKVLPGKLAREYDEMYAGKQLLVLKGVEHFYRQYEWS
jgi:hydroxymethylglutaryl-CoA synthase